MNGRVAKRLRKEIYGDFSLRDKKKRRDENGVITNTGLRKDYLAAKKAYYRSKE